jgi:ppGpp synthetase/RelA/SpoT-type nucleotidyltranferase
MHRFSSPEGRATAAVFAARAQAELFELLGSSRDLLLVPEEGISWRLKSDAAIHAKVAAGKLINDFVGMRVIAVCVDRLGEIEEKLPTWETRLGLRRDSGKNTFESPARGGFRSIQIDYQISNIVGADLPAGCTLELQLTTWLQYLHTQLSHDLYYKASHRNRAAAVPFLETLSEHIHGLDVELAKFLRR